MTISNINTSPVGTWPNPNKADLENIKNIESTDKVNFESDEKKLTDEAVKKLEAALDSLVLKPSPVSIEERMDQVISFEEMKSLLSMVTKSSKITEDRKMPHLIDVKR
ncbi:MAG: hypothetical protein L6Q54_04925 [Leptospiraceae bacterium]|nr:hypothetical protein [Leptospiraceae bacterium]MCK6380580.1 hypothetical protein [Leptospiraceae bacterium]NUM40339.1 hypothetical protein [Leptospiraceae bacterium]